MQLNLQPGEKLLTIGDAFEQEIGQRPTPATCNRWAMKGIGGIRLATAKYGRKRMTTLRAVRNWIKARTAAEEGTAA